MGTGSITIVGSPGTSTLTTQLTGLTNHTVLVGAGTATITKVGPGSAGQVLQSGGAAADPVYSTATYPATTTINEILYSSSANTVAGITAGANGVLISSNTNVPSWLANSGTPGFVLTANAGAPPSWQSAASGGAITSFQPDSGTNPVVPNAGLVIMAGSGSVTTVGGTNTLTFQLTGLTNHAVLVGAGTATITKVGPTATAGQVLQSAGSSADPAFSTATYPATTTINQILYSSSNNVVGGITASIDGVLISSHTGIPSWLANSGTPGFILTANSGAPPSWQTASASGAITTITGNSGGAESPSAGNFNILGTGSITVAGSANTETVQLTGLTNHAVLVGAGTATISNIGPTATVGQILQSAGASADPAFSTATYPATTTINDILYSSSNNVVGQITASNNGVLISGTTGIPSWLGAGSTGQVLVATTSNPASWGTLSGIAVTSVTATAPLTANGASGSAQTGAVTVALTTPLALTYGGTNASLTASNGGIFYSTATAGAILSGTATANQVLLSGSSTTPAWSTATYPATTTINQLLYSSSNNVIAGVTAANNGTLISGTTGIPSWLANGTTGQILTATTGSPPSWGAAPSSSISITGDSGGALTGASFTIYAHTASSNSGSSVSISGSGTTLTLNLTDANSNTIMGNNAGNGTLSGSFNVSVGINSLLKLTSGQFNCGLGPNSLESITSGTRNCGIGYGALNGPTTGAYNIGIGHNSGSNYTSSESSNILFNNGGTNAESNVLRIGAGSGTGSGQLAKAFISGIAGVTVTSTSAVLVNTSTDQLGTVVSSQRFKENIRDMGDASEIIYSLRPVAFTYKQNPEMGRQTGLIAEEVIEVAPQLVCLDREGLPCAVAYHDLPALLLNEIQKLQKRIKELEDKVR